MNKGQEKITLPFLCGLLFIAVCVCMLSPLNPLSKNIPGTDSSVFLTIGQGMINGKLPYVDFFDHKGPLIYFINAAGLFIGGWIGVWGIELLFMFISAFFAYKTSLFFAGKFPAFLGTAFSFIALTSFFMQGNLTEEYVLPFIFISLYIYAKYYFKQTELEKIQIITLGACFGASLLLRPNMFAVWLSFCAVIFVQKMYQKEYKSIIQYTLFFCSGVLCVLLPVLLYLTITGSLKDCIDQYIVFNIAYSNSPVLAPTTFFFYIKRFAAIAKNVNVLVSFLIALVWLFKKPVDTKYGFYAGYAISWLISFFLIVLSRMNSGHYYMVLIPLFIPVVSFCTNIFFKYQHVYIKYCVPVLVLCALLNNQIFYNNQFSYAIHNVRETRNDSRIYFSKLGKLIDDNTAPDDVISVLGNQCDTYLFTHRGSASKYIYQQPIAQVSPKIKMEYISDIKKTQPKFLIIPPLWDDGMFDSLSVMLDTGYYELFVSGYHIIYKRKYE